MAVDREALQGEMERSKSERNQGGVNFVGEGSVRLRILEFVDAVDGKTKFARKVVQWGHNGPNNKRVNDSVHRTATFGDGVPDAFERMQEIANETGAAFPYTCRKQFYVNAIKIDDKNPKVERWALPTGVWEDVSAVVLNDEWADVLEPDTGHAFLITGQGKMFDRTYTVTVERNPYPVPAVMLQQVVDPLSAVHDPGLHGQCQKLGQTVEALFGDATQLEMVEPILTGDQKQAERQVTPPARLPAQPPQRGPVLPQRTAAPASGGGNGAPGGYRPPPNGSRPAPALPAASANKLASGRSAIGALAGPRRPPV